MRRNDNRIGLQGLVNGLLFSLHAEGRSARTIEYYNDLLCPLIGYVKDKGWLDDVSSLDPHSMREFLSWVGSRTCEHSVGNGTKRLRKAKPSTAWPYYKALRRLFNWSIEEGFLKESPVKDIHFKAPPLPPVQPYDSEELRRFFAICELDIKSGARFTGLRNKAMLLLFIDSGLRLTFAGLGLRVRAPSGGTKIILNVTLENLSPVAYLPWANP